MLFPCLETDAVKAVEATPRANPQGAVGILCNSINSVGTQAVGA